MTPKQWVENWKRVGPILEKIEAEELRTMDAQKTMEQIVSMSDWCIEHTELRQTTGLIEQQRIFAKARKRNR